MKKKVDILGLRFCNMGLDETVEWILRNKGTVYCCTLNEVMSAEEDGDYKRILNKGDALMTDGMPLVWLMKFKAGKGKRVYGPDLMRKFLGLNPKIPQFFIGDEKNEKYFNKFGKYLVLPFKDRFDEGDYKIISKEIRKSKAEVVWVGLGAKKQIMVADELKRRLPDRVYITVGAAFDFLSGNKKQAPKWLRNSGGEWLFRWLEEPRRLTIRYLKIIEFLMKITVRRIVRVREGDRHRRGKV